MNLDGKVAIVTGGAVRLGRAMAVALAESGARICLQYGRSRTEAREVVDLIRRAGGEATRVHADFRDPAVAATRCLAHAIEEFGQVDILVNSAAIFRRGTCRTTTETDWDEHFDINLKSPFLLVKRFVGRLSPGQRAHVVNITDWRGHRPGQDCLAYTLTKSALETMTRALAQDLAPEVQVNAIAPGAILPPPGAPDSFIDRISSRIPLRRIGDPEEIVQTLLFLLRSDFITGEVVGVTGGEQL